MYSKTAHHRVFLLALALAIPLVASSRAQDSSTADSSQNPAVAADVLQEPDVQDLGRRSPGAMIDILVTVRFNHEDALEQLLSEQSDPSSANYHKYLTPAEFAQRFGPTAEQLSQVVTELQRAGFQITDTSTNRLIIHASAPTITVENYFKTEIHTVNQESSERYMNVTPAMFPDRLVSLVKAVRLDNLTVAHKLSAENIVPNSISGPITGPDGGYTPVALADSFDFPVQHGYDGTGHTAAVIIDSDVADTDLNTFFSYFSISRTGTITRKSVDGATIGKKTADVDETALDVETIASLAPGANVIIYLIPRLSSVAIDDAANKIVSDNTAEVVNMSFGGNEFKDATFESALQQGNAQGITFVASSGDSGSNGGIVSTPAAEPRVLALGGTKLTANKATGAYVAEKAWHGSGGGVSKIFTIPTYQQGTSGLASTTHRNVPDVAFPSYYTDTFVSGGWVGLQGTSWSSPTYVGLQLEINQIKSQRFGLVNTNLYQVFSASGYTNFHDITAGNNGKYRAKSGYDNVTGIGSPKGFTLGGNL